MRSSRYPRSAAAKVSTTSCSVIGLVSEGILKIALRRGVRGFSPCGDPALCCGGPCVISYPQNGRVVLDGDNDVTNGMCQSLNPPALRQNSCDKPSPRQRRGPEAEPSSRGMLATSIARAIVAPVGVRCPAVKVEPAAAAMKDDLDSPLGTQVADST